MIDLAQDILASVGASATSRKSKKTIPPTMISQRKRLRKVLGGGVPGPQEDKPASSPFFSFPPDMRPRLRLVRLWRRNKEHPLLMQDRPRPGLLDRQWHRHIHIPIDDLNHRQTDHSAAATRAACRATSATDASSSLSVHDA